MADSRKKTQSARYGSPTIAGRVTKKGTQRAGKGKGTLAQRKAQNKGVKDGTIRIGRGGKSYNVYDAKTATWKRGVVKKSESPKSPKSTKPMTGRGGYGSANKPKSKAKGHYTGATTGNLRPGQPTLGDYFSRNDSRRRRNAATAAAKVTAKYGKTGARAQSAVYRRERRKK